MNGHSDCDENEYDSECKVFGYENGRRPDEEEEAYRRRCLLNASRVVMIPPKKNTGGLSYNIYNDLTIQIQLIINQITINFELSLLSSQLYILRI